MSSLLYDRVGGAARRSDRSDHRTRGELLISVNGSELARVPPSAFRFNGYNGYSPEGIRCESGPPWWCGTDQGSFEGSWGQSQVDLSTLVKPGDRVQFRFYLHTGSCDLELGLHRSGWFVDDVKVVSCGAVPTATP